MDIGPIEAVVEASGIVVPEVEEVVLGLRLRAGGPRCNPAAAIAVHLIMGVVARRLLGLLLLVLAIGIPSCQAIFPRAAGNEPRPAGHVLPG